MDKEILNKEILELLKNYKSITTLPVQWGEMDVANHVNNAIYLRYAESARIAYFEEMEYSMSDFTKVAPILAEVTVQYKIPVVFPDTIIMGTKILQLGNTSMVMETVIISEKLKKIATYIKAVVVMYDYNTLQKAPIPEFFRKKITTIENLL
jgi:acyl-CoA thioester hydrolase